MLWWWSLRMCFFFGFWLKDESLDVKVWVAAIYSMMFGGFSMLFGGLGSRSINWYCRWASMWTIVEHSFCSWECKIWGTVFVHSFCWKNLLWQGWTGTVWVRSSFLLLCNCIDSCFFLQVRFVFSSEEFICGPIQHCYWWYFLQKMPIKDHINPIGSWS